jgi:hypothetical protein
MPLIPPKPPAEPSLPWCLANRHALGDYFATVKALGNLGAVITNAGVTALYPVSWGKDNALVNFERTSLKPDPSLLVWLDGSIANSFALASGKIAAWIDQSGNANNAVQATASLQPTYTAAARNGFAGATFLNSSLSVPSLTLSDFTMVAVMSATANGLIWEHSADANINLGHYLYSSTVQSSLLNRVPGGNAHIDPTGFSYFDISASWGVQGATYYIVSQRSGSAGVDVKTNGTARGSSFAPTAITVTQPLFIGCRDSSAAFIAGTYLELRAYNRALTDAELSALVAQLNAKWTIF